MVEVNDNIVKGWLQLEDGTKVHPYINLDNVYYRDEIGTRFDKEFQELKELVNKNFQYVSKVKQYMAESLTDEKGVPTLPDDTFLQIAKNILAIDQSRASYVTDVNITAEKTIGIETSVSVKSIKKVEHQDIIIDVTGGY